METNTKREDPHPYFCSNKQNKNNLFDGQVWVKSHLSHGGKGFTLPMVNATLIHRCNLVDCDHKARGFS